MKCVTRCRNSWWYCTLRPFLLLAIADYFLASADDIRRSAASLQLPPLQATKLAQLFNERNISLQFHINQQPHAECVLFRLEDVERVPVVEVSSSTVDNYIKLIFKTHLSAGERRSYKINAPLNDGIFHRLIVVFSGNELRVVDNCREIFSVSDDELNLQLSSAEGVKIFIASDQVVSGESVGFHGQIREFTAGAGDAVTSRCAASLEAIIANPVLKETVAAEVAASDSPQDITPQDNLSRDETTNDNSKLLGRQLADAPLFAPERGQLSALAERVNYLERQMSHWNTVYDKFDNRVKQIELHLRGCQVGGRLLTFGQRHQHIESCTECQCSSSGQLHCGPIGCPKLDCAHPISVAGRCCPHCGRQCLYNGRHYESGEEFWPKQCVHCLCDDGSMQCQFKQTTQCPVLDCEEQFTPPNRCCAVCVNIDHCAAHRNPCHADALCMSGEYSATCTCKPGFFGNGTVCYDIDECLWDENARQQLGGCQPGSICINLPGSFKCDCLPGFQKLDERSCLDIIRI